MKAPKDKHIKLKPGQVVVLSGPDTAHTIRVILTDGANWGVITRSDAKLTANENVPYIYWLKPNAEVPK